jgi:transcriptional regulator with XRE-family HTH domain
MAEEVVVNVGESLRRLRGECGYSIKQLSQKSGVSPAGIYKIERNEMVPTITVLMKLAAALNKKVGFFVGEEDDSKDVELVRDGFPTGCSRSESCTSTPVRTVDRKI